jgi:hypothetical protein
MNVNQLSEKLLLVVKMQAPTGEVIARLEDLPSASLKSNLDSDARKKAFWINIYNAFFQILRKERGVDKPDIYRLKLINIAGYRFSLDDIEHGILRKYRLKWALGYLPNPLVSTKVRAFAVKKIDYRIHFALNCGARSCPPIAFYSPDKIERQLDMATLSFLENDTEVFPEKKEIHTTRLFQWFIGDFGGVAGVRRILEQNLKLDLKGMRLIFKSYDWEEELDNFQMEATK